MSPANPSRLRLLLASHSSFPLITLTNSTQTRNKPGEVVRKSRSTLPRLGQLQKWSPQR
jgi:hypothetical protein